MAKLTHKWTYFSCLLTIIYIFTYNTDSPAPSAQPGVAVQAQSVAQAYCVCIYTSCHLKRGGPSVLLHKKETLIRK